MNNLNVDDDSALDVLKTHTFELCVYFLFNVKCPGILLLVQNF